MSFYPQLISERFGSPRHAGSDESATRGRSASFVCGSFIELFVRIDDERGLIETAKYRTNGCGYMIAAAEVLCDWLEGKPLADLHGLDDAEMMQAVSKELGEFAPDRVQCASVVFGAIRTAMAIHRERLVEEFVGEKALICTCFGVSEETIEREIAAKRFTEVQQVADSIRAGSGCGSCRFLIQELIDMRDPQFE